MYLGGNLANKDTLVRTFVKANICTILSKDDKSAVIKKLRQKFFSKYHVSSADIFDNHTIAYETVNYLINLGKIKSVEQLEELCEAKFIGKYLKHVDKKYFENMLETEKFTALPTEDLKHLSHDEYLIEMGKKLKEEAKLEVEKQLAKERESIESIKKELQRDLISIKKLKSELDKLPPEPDIENLVEDTIIESEGEIETDKGNLFWWERLGLERNPFPGSHRGLLKIPEDKYDSIVVITDILDKYVKTLTRHPEEIFGQTIILTGQFGSGKTTIFQYISHLLGQSRIFPIFTILDPKDNWESIREQLYINIYEKISLALKKRSFVDPRSEGQPIDRSNVALGMEILCKEYSTDGVILFIDGLHKGDRTVKSSLEFVKQLQNLHEYFEDRGLNIGIIIASSPLWKRTLETDSSYHGSYTRIDEIPPITFDEAFKLLQLRINAFRLDDAIPIFYDRSTIEFAFAQLSSSTNGNVTFRDFIKYIVPRLSKGEFEQAGISVDIDMEAFDKIDRYLRESVIADQYKLFRKITSGKPNSRNACSKVLLNMYESRSITEKDELFLKNKGAFWTLRKAKLIEKVSKDLGSGVSFAWSISSDMLVALNELNNYGIPAKVIFKAFSIDPDSRKIVVDSKKDEPTIKCERILEKWSSEWPEIVPQIESFLRYHKKIQKGFILSDEKLLELCKKGMSELILAMQKASETGIDEEDWARKTWLGIESPESIEHVIKTETLSTDDRSAFFQSYCHGINIILDTMLSLLKSSGITSIASLKLGFREKEILFRTICYFESGALQHAIDEISNLIENEIRKSFNIVLSINGDGTVFQRLPDGLRSNIDKNRNRGKHLLQTTAKANQLYHLSRGEYAQIISYKNNWLEIFQPAFKGRDKKEVVDALNIIFSLDTRSHHRDEPNYFRKVREQIMLAIKNASWLLEGISELYTLAINPPHLEKKEEGDQILFKISFLKDQMNTDSTYISISKSDGKKIAKKIERYQEIDLLDEGGIIARYNVSPISLCLVISYGVHEGKIKIIKSKESISCFFIEPLKK